MSAREVAQSVPVSPLDDLYFIRAESGPIKIGRGRDPKKRLTQCRTGSHEKLVIFGTLPGRGYEEKVWHAAFQDNRLCGEWFEYEEELKLAMEKALAGEEWWHHLTPPFAFDLSDDEEEYADDIVDWHIAICLAVAAAKRGEKPPLKDVNDLSDYAQNKVVELINLAAERSWSESEHSIHSSSGRG